MWKAWKGVSFDAIQGLYEMSIWMQRVKIREMRNISEEPFGPRRKLEGKQLEAKMKASKAARITHQILKWTDLINQDLNWRVHDIIARKTELELNEGNPVILKHHDRCCEKKKASLIKHMHALRSLIAPFDPEAEEHYDDEEEGNGEEEGDQPLRPTGKKFISDQEKIKKICDGSPELGPVKKMDFRSEEERRAAESETRNRHEELKLQTFLNNEMSKDEVEDIADQVWRDPREDNRLAKACLALRAGCMNHTLGMNPKEEDKFIKRADALRNRGEWQLDKKHTYRRMILTGDMPSWLQPVEAMAKHYQPVWCPEETNEDGSPNLDCYHYHPPGSESPWMIKRDDATPNATRMYRKFMTNGVNIARCLRTKNNLSALGPDGIGYLFLKLGNAPMIEFIRQLFKRCVGRETFQKRGSNQRQYSCTRKVTLVLQITGVRSQSHHACIVCLWH
jgi:hypothetical protein